MKSITKRKMVLHYAYTCFTINFVCGLNVSGAQHGATDVSEHIFANEIIKIVLRWYENMFRDVIIGLIPTAVIVRAVPTLNPYELF